MLRSILLKASRRRWWLPAPHSKAKPMYVWAASQIFDHNSLALFKLRQPSPAFTCTDAPACKDLTLTYPL